MSTTTQNLDTIAFDFSIFGLVLWYDQCEAGLQAIRVATGFATVAAGLLILAAGLLFGLLTRNLDERVVQIVEGLSRIFGAVVLFVLALVVPGWTGWYFHFWQTETVQVGNHVKVLRFNVLWSLLVQKLGMIYVLMFPFLTGGREHAYTIPLSVLVGAMGGLLLEAAVRYCNNPTTCTLQRRNWISFGIAFSFVIASGGLFADGCVFIALVWAKSNVGNFSVDVPAFFSWFAVGCITHYYLWWKTKQLRGLAAADKENNDVNGKASSGTPEGDDDDAGDVDEEDIGYDVDAEEEDKKYDEDEENVKKQAVNEELPQETNAAEQDDDEVPSTCALLRGKFRCQCCGCARGTEKSAFQKAGFTIGWTLWVILNCAALYFVVVNIGATHQGEIVNEKLPAVYEEVYRYMDEGPVCAYNGTKYGDMQTFPDKDAAHDAGYLILHCGACGACSDWHNLRLEYTTRNFLAEESAKCARKSLFGGYQDVVDCLSAPEPINFLGKCAECWATDILCTKANCTFIFLQSTMIDAVGNFAVGPDTVTAASCEEAHCEAGQFVPCSGATRRRMNVTSSIARPGAQRCSIVDVDWAELFPE